jgi:hypothetical protein
VCNCANVDANVLQLIQKDGERMSESSEDMYSLFSSLKTYVLHCTGLMDCPCALHTAQSIDCPYVCTWRWCGRTSS